MPLTIFKKLGLGEYKKTTVSLQLPDRNIKHSRGILEDILVKVEEEKTTLILGKPFLPTRMALINVEKGK